MCWNAVLNMGCDSTYFDGVDYYGKCMFTCPLPPAVRAFVKRRAREGKEDWWGIRGVGVGGEKFQ